MVSRQVAKTQRKQLQLQGWLIRVRELKPMGGFRPATLLGTLRRLTALGPLIDRMVVDWRTQARKLATEFHLGPRFQWDTQIM
jgi:hypothetical protein